MGLDSVVPLSMKPIAFKSDTSPLLIRNLAPRRILAPRETATDLQPLGRGWVGNKLPDGFIIPPRLAAPVGWNEGKETGLDLVPFAGARREVTCWCFQTGLVGQTRPRELPKPQAPAIAASASGGNEPAAGLGMELPALLAPPAADRSHGPGAGIMIGAHIYKTAVESEVVKAVGIGARNLRTRKIVPLNLQRLLAHPPLTPGIMVVAHQFLLFGVHRNRGFPFRETFPDFAVAVTELRSAVGMPPLPRFCDLTEGGIRNPWGGGRLLGGWPDGFSGTVAGQWSGCVCSSPAEEIGDRPATPLRLFSPRPRRFSDPFASLACVRPPFSGCDRLRVRFRNEFPGGHGRWPGAKAPRRGLPPRCLPAPNSGPRRRPWSAGPVRPAVAGQIEISGTVHSEFPCR